MQKSKFLTFCFAFIPGAGQMYQGYMKRGLSLISLACAIAMLGFLVGAFLPLLLIVFMYSFFDALNLHAQLRAGTAPADEALLHLGLDEDWSRFWQKRHHWLGGGLVFAGVCILYETTLMPWFWSLASRFPSLNWLLGWMHNLPQLAVAVGMIWLGWYLIRGERPARQKRPSTDEIPPVPEEE